MTTNCPKCGAALKDDYGMVTCPSCGVILFIDMDGMAHFGSADEAAALPESAPEVATESELPPSFEFAPLDETPELEAAPVELAPSPESEVGEAPLGDFAFALPEVSTPDEPVLLSEPEPEEPELAPGEAIPESEFSMDSLLGYAEPEAPADTYVEDSSLGQPGDPLGLNSYANSEVSQAKDGMLSFRLLISGIDSKEMRDSLRQALEDSRFGWNAISLMSKIRLGVLRIDNVSPVKASILVNRIKRLPVQIRWEQYAITQMEGAGDETGEPDDSSTY